MNAGSGVLIEKESLAPVDPTSTLLKEMALTHNLHFLSNPDESL